MKRISGRIFALFAFVFVVTLIATAPATLLAKIMEGSSNGQLLLVNATGTVWQGGASPAIRQRSGKLVVSEKLHWDVAFLPLFTGKMRIDFQWENVAQALPMAVTISFNHIELRNAVIPLQASVLGELTPLLQPVQLRGQMLIKSDQFTFSRQGLAGNAVADWLAAGSVLSNVDPLGNYRINLVGAGERLDLVLMTLSGALLLEGRGSFAAKRGLSFQVSARAAADSKGSLDELLSNFGPQTAPGVHTLNLTR